MFEDWPELPEEEEQENAACIARFEQMLSSGTSSYFDEDEYLFIIDNYMQTNDLSKAQLALERSLEAFPHRLSLQLRRVGLLSALEQTDEALKLLQKIDKQYSNADVFCLYEEAVLYLDLKQWDASEQKFNAVLNLPECERREVVCDPNFYNDLSLLYEEEGKMYQAIETKQQAILLGIAFAEDLAYLIFQLREHEDFDDSVRFFHQKVEENPLSELDWLCLGKVYMEEGKISEAREAFDNAMALGKEDAEANVDLATLLALEGKDTECEQLLQQYFQLHNSNRNDKLRCYHQIARFTYEHRLLQSCLYFSQKCIDLQPLEAFGYAMIALVHGETGSYEKGLDALNKAISIAPDELQNWLLRNDYLLQIAPNNEDDEDKIETEFQTCCERFPNEANTWLDYSNYLAKTGNIDKAIRLLKHAKNIENHPIYLYRLAYYYFLKGDDVNGCIYLEMGYATHPEYLFDFTNYDEDILKKTAVINFLNEIQNEDE